MDDLPELRANVPALEPDAVLLGQLVELSAASTAAVTARPKLRPVRALTVGAAALGLVAATSWIAGALPGVPSPLVPGPDPTTPPTAPATPNRTSDVPVPGADDGPTSGTSRPHAEVPGVVPGSRTPASGTPGWTPPGSPSAHPTTPGGGRSVGQSPEKHPDQGKHLGQQKPKKEKSNQGRSGTRRKGQHSPPPSSSGRPDGAGPTNDHTTGP